MNQTAAQWLNDMVEYENEGGIIPEDIRAGLFYAFVVQNWRIVVYDVRFDIMTESFAVVAAWMEQNGPDLPRFSLPKPVFGL